MKKPRPRRPSSLVLAALVVLCASAACTALVWWLCGPPFAALVLAGSAIFAAADWHTNPPSKPYRRSAEIMQPDRHNKAR